MFILFKNKIVLFCNVPRETYACLQGPFSADSFLVVCQEFKQKLVQLATLRSRNKVGGCVHTLCAKGKVGILFTVLIKIS